MKCFKLDKMPFELTFSNSNGRGKTRHLHLKTWSYDNQLKMFFKLKSVSLTWIWNYSMLIYMELLEILIVGLGRLGYLFNKGRNIFKRMELF